jgi:hypothetical protein
MSFAGYEEKNPSIPRLTRDWNTEGRGKAENSLKYLCLDSVGLLRMWEGMTEHQSELEGGGVMPRPHKGN